VRVPLAVPVTASKTTFAQREYLLVEVKSDEGVRGIGASYVGTGGARAAAIAARDLLVPHVIGSDPAGVKAVWDRMYQAVWIQGRSGLVMNAISAIDIALWDCYARSVGRPLHVLLGAPSDRTTVGAYASGGYYAAGKDNGALKEEVTRYVDAGFRSVKIKAGKLSLKDEERRTAAIRQAIGDDVLLMLDAYQAWTDVPTAQKYVQMFRQFAPFWIEDPFPPDNLDAYARLAASIPEPVATGEFHYGYAAFKAIIDRGAATILQAEAPRCGGVTEWMRVADLAFAHGIGMSPDWFHDIHIHLVAGARNGMFVEYFPDRSVLNFGLLIDRQLEVRNGELVLPTEPGLGFAFDPAAVRRYAIRD
jgi:L-alanine-DL-glutamate epimerase-like enolase superfamily enzyme